MKYLAILLLSLLVVLPGFAETAADSSDTVDSADTADSADSGASADTVDTALETPVFKDFDDIANHYKCYTVQPLLGQVLPPVTLSDQFKQSQARVLRPRYLCNPTKKNNTGIVDEDLHYVCFDIEQNLDPALPDVQTSNQFGTQFLRPIQSELLCLPSKKEHL